MVKDKMIERIQSSSTKETFERNIRFSVDNDGSLRAETSGFIGWWLPSKDANIAEFYVSSGWHVSNFDKLKEFIENLALCFDQKLLSTNFGTKVERIETFEVAKADNNPKEPLLDKLANLEGQVEVYERLTAREFTLKT